MKNLDLIEIASPCPVSWDKMVGDDRVRFCRECRLNVYNIAEMTREEAQQFVNQREGRMCVRFFRREDGTVLTKDCPIGVKALRQRFCRLLAAVASILAASLAGPLLGSFVDRRLAGRLSTPLTAIAQWIDPSPMFLGAVMLTPSNSNSLPISLGVEVVSPQQQSESAEDADHSSR